MIMNGEQGLGRKLLSPLKAKFNDTISRVIHYSRMSSKDSHEFGVANSGLLEGITQIITQIGDSHPSETQRLPEQPLPVLRICIYASNPLM
jgi:hypothetical protein